MSTTIDRKVVEMRFDNKHFESNVKETMSTLERLKQKLNLSGAAKGLDNISASAKKVNMDGLAGGIDTVHAKFSALEVIGVTALANITNSAVEAGKRFISALTVAPVSDGWQEYEMTLNAIQTTMAGTGKTAEEVQKELKKLDEYADKTVYSTADMLNNLPKFTNAGVELEKATTAMIGIANATALAGGDANKASIAFYNLGQAIGTGYLTRMDYNSINNAGIATMEWKKQMVEAAIAAGTLTKVGEDSYKAGNKTLTLQQLFIDGLQEQWASTEVLMKVFGDYGDETTEIGKKAYSAAQDIKTFTMMMDSLKATAGTGWKDTWQIIFGDLDEAKELWTGLTNFLSNIITSMADFRNNLLAGALSFNPFSLLMEKLDNSTLGKAVNKVQKTSQTLEHYQNLVNQIWRGDYGNRGDNPDRFDLLTADGYNPHAIQAMVNMGYQYKLTLEDITRVEEKFGVAVTEVTEATEDKTEALESLTDEQLKAMGLTEEEIRLYRQLEKQSKKTGKSISELLKEMESKSGRTLLIESFVNVGKSLIQVFGALKEAFIDAFPPITSLQLYNLIANFNEFTSKLVMSDDTVKDLTRTLKGLFAIIDIITVVVGGAFRIAWTVFKAVLSLFNLDVLEFTAILGDGIVAFRDWIEENSILVKGVTKLAEIIRDAVLAVAAWIDKNVGIAETMDKVKRKIWEFIAGVQEWFKGLKETDNVGLYIIQGLLNGLKTGATYVFKFVKAIGLGIINAIKEILGIHSPSTEFFEIGKNIMQGLFNGISEFVKMVYNLVMTIGGKLIEIIKSLDLGSIFTIAIGTGATFAFIKIAKALEAFSSPLEEVGDLVNQARKSLKTFTKSFKQLASAFSFRLVAEGIKSMAIAVAILAGSIIALTFVDTKKMLIAVGAITVLMAVLAGLVAVAGHFGKDKKLEFGKISLTLIGLGIAMALMASAMKKIAKIPVEKYWHAIGGFIAIIGSMIGMMAIVANGKNSVAKIGKTFMSIAGALLIMAFVAKIAGGMDPSELIQGGLAVVAFSGIIVGLMAATKLLTGSKNVDKIGKTIAKVATAILMMLVVAKIAGGMDRKALSQGITAIIAFSGIIVGLMAATKLISGSTNVGKIGGAISGIASALLMMVFVAKIAAGMKPADLFKGTLVIAAFSGIIVGLMAATKLIAGSKNVSKIGKTILTLSVAIGLMGITAALLSMISLEGLAKGVIAVGILAGLMVGLIAVTKNAKNVMGTVIAITSAIAVLAIAVGVLSMIDPAKLVGPTIAIGALLGMLALVIKMTGSSKKAMSTLIIITVALVALGGILYLLAQLPVEQTMGTAIALTMLMLAMTVMLGVISLVGSMSMSGIGALALLTAIVGVLALIIKSLAGLDAHNTIAIVGALIVMLTTMSAVLVILSVVGLLGPAAFIGIGALATLIVGMGAVMAAIGALVSKFPSLETFVDKGIPILEKVANGIGSIVASLVAGALTTLTASLPEIGTNLSLFMTNLEPFVEGAKQVDAQVLAGVGILGASVLALVAANFIENIASFLQFGSSFSSLGTELSKFMINAMPFITLSKQLDPSIMQGVKALADAIMTIVGTNILESATAWLTGGNSLEDFGSQLGGLGKSLNTFTTSLGTFDEAKVATIDCACRAIKSLAGAAKTLPNEGGLWAKIAGENSLATFADKLPGVGTHLGSFVTNLGTFDEAKVATVDCAGRAIKALAEAASEIPNEGGLWAAIVGDNSLATFGSYLPGLGTHLSSFVTNLGTFGEDKIATVDCACAAIKGLAAAAKTIPNEGGLWAKIAGENSLATFADKLPGIATHVAKFVTNLGTFSGKQVTTVDSACKAIKTIAELGKIDIDKTGDGLNSFGKNMANLSKKIKEFVKNVGGVSADSISSAINKTKELITMAQSVAAIDDESLKTFGDSLKNIAKNGVKGFVKEFSGKTATNDVKKAAKTLLNSAVDGMGEKKNAIEKESKKLAEAAIDKFCTKALKKDAEGAGKDLVTGFANGIKNNKSLATSAGTTIGKAALSAAKKAIDSNSPSKEAMKIGNYFGQGLIIGIHDYENKTYAAGYGIADKAKDGLTRAVSKISALISSDIDTQPTIRPVLDLSDVESGAGYLNSMFNSPSIGVMSNIRAISSGMNARLQNGVNSDVVSSIDKLRGDLGKLPQGDVYNLNGITYNGESEIAEAVQTIVRVARMERRS